MVIYEADQYGNPVSSDNSTQITATLASGAGPLQGTVQVTVVGGIATFTDLYDDRAVVIILSFAGGGLPAVSSGSIAVAAGNATSLAVTKPPSGPVAGVPFGLTVNAIDGYQNLATSFNGSVTIALANGSGGNLSGTTTVTASEGVATFNNLVSTVSGSISLAASSGSSLSSPPTAPIPVTPAPASVLIITTAPSSTQTAGAPFEAAPVISEEDQYGNVETGDNSTVITASLGTGVGPLSGTETMTVVAGVATFGDIIDDTAETITLIFSGGTLTPATTSSITVNPAAPSQLVITKAPSTATAGVKFNLQPVVKEEDQFGNIIKSDSTSTVTAARGDQGTASLQGTKLTVTLVKGVATFTGLYYDMAETMDISFTTNAEGVAPATSGSIVVSPNIATQLILSMPGQTVTTGEVFPTQPVIAEEDTYGNVETGDNTTQVTVTLATGTGPLEGTLQETVEGGVATFTNLADDLPETITLGFNGGGLSAGPSNAIVVQIGPTVKLAVALGAAPPSLVRPGETLRLGGGRRGRLRQYRAGIHQRCDGGARRRRRRYRW